MKQDDDVGFYEWAQDLVYTAIVLFVTIVVCCFIAGLIIGLLAYKII